MKKDDLAESSVLSLIYNSSIHSSILSSIHPSIHLFIHSSIYPSTLVVLFYCAFEQVRPDTSIYGNFMSPRTEENIISPREKDNFKRPIVRKLKH